MKPILVTIAVLAGISGIACSPHTQNTPMEAITFFAKPPKAERAFLSAYKSESLDGQFGIRIETEPLSFVDPDLDRELEPEILLEYLAVPSIDPNRLENTRFQPASGALSTYEGSFYFLGQHNWVDLLEIRFLNATGNSILAEYDLVIHLPKAPPDEYSITLRVQTEIETGEPELESPRIVEGFGTLVQSKEHFWNGKATYNGHEVNVEFSAEVETFDEMVTYAQAVITEQTLPRSKMNREIAKGLGFLTDKLKRFNAPSDIKADDFVPRTFYFHKRRHHESPEMIIVLYHPSNNGHWSLTFYDIDSGVMNWVPKSDLPQRK